MAIKRKNEAVVNAYRIVNDAKISKMEDAEKFAFIKMVRQLKKAGTEFDDFLKDAQERLKPDGFDDIIGKIQKKESLTTDETFTINKYNADVQECVKDELEKEIELDFEPLSEDAFGRLIASNDFSVSQILSISDVIAS